MNSTTRTAPYDEDALVRLALSGDLDAFDQLVLANQDSAYNHAYARLGDPASAEEAAQESFIKAFRSMDGFRGGSFCGWLLRIVTNSAYDMLRRSHRRPTQSLFLADDNGEEIESLAWLADPSASVQDAVEKHELSEDVYKMLDELPDVYRSVITLIDLYEHR